MTAISYVAAALPEPSLCLPAANALRDLCDSNRAVLAPHIASFAELHAGLTDVPVCWILYCYPFVALTFMLQDTEKMKVLQSIASVIQSLPPAEQIPPVEVYRIRSLPSSTFPAYMSFRQSLIQWLGN